MDQKPIIAIYRDGMRYRVEIEGKEVERLKSFAVQLDAMPKDGIHEAPSCMIEQYLPLRRLGSSGSASSSQPSAGEQEESVGPV